MIGAHGGHGWTRISLGTDKGTRKTQKMLTSREIISVSSVSSVWDKKGHTERTESTEREGPDSYFQEFEN